MKRRDQASPIASWITSVASKASHHGFPPEEGFFGPDAADVDTEEDARPVLEALRRVSEGFAGDAALIADGGGTFFSGACGLRLRTGDLFAAACPDLDVVESAGFGRV